MRFEDVARAVEGVPFMTPEQGRLVYDAIRRERPAEVLELGTAHGVGAAYMAAALEANGGGRLTTVETTAKEFTGPAPRELLERAGVSHRVTLDRSFSTYNWFLKTRIEERSDAAGNCEPLYDFVYLDGSKNWTVDGLAVFLIEKLLKPGGWLLMDDLSWTYAGAGVASSDGVRAADMTPEERSEPHLRAIFDLIVRQHPSFVEFLVQDETWGWARKGEGPRRLTLETTVSMQARLLRKARQVAERRIAARQR